MKPRNREISIFSLSMMDVISGAMGAFLVLVVILSRHYEVESPDAEIIRKLQVELVQATGSLEEASRRIDAGTGDATDIERHLRQALQNVNAGKAHIRQLRNDLDVANARAARLQEEVASLEDRAGQLESELASWTPFVFVSKWECDRSTDVDIYLLVPGETEDGRSMPAFDPRASQTRFFNDEIAVDFHGGRQSTDVWVSGRNYSGEIIKVYYRLDRDESDVARCSVRSWVISNHAADQKFERLELTPEQAWLYVGTIGIGEDGDLELTPASRQERAREHAEVLRRMKDS